MSAEGPSSLPDDYLSQIKDCLIPQDSEDLMLALTHVPLLMQHLCRNLGYLSEMVQVTRNRSEQAEESLSKARERLKGVSADNRMLADKLRERESADCMQVITSNYRDQVIEHMSQQLSHFETLHRTCLTFSTDNS